MSLLPHLPPELVARIINHLRDSPATLKSCALVSRSWLSPSRSHIFRKISLKPSRYTNSFFGKWGKQSTAQLLLSIIEVTPEIASYVWDVEIVKGIELGEGSSSEKELVSLLLLLNNVQQLRLRRSIASPMMWRDLSSAFRDSILHILSLPSFSELSLDLLSFVNSKELGRLLGYSPGLRTVSLSHLRVFEPEDDQTSGPENLLPNGGRTPLDSLTLGARTSPLVVGCLLHPESYVDIFALRKLSISMSSSFGEFARILRSAVYLESLDILLMSDVDLVAYQALPLTERLDLSYNPGISALTVTIDVIQRQDDPLPWLNQLFLTVTTPNSLRAVHIVYSLYLPSPYMDRSVNTTIFTKWEDIDATLTGPIFHSLERVWLEFSLENPIGIGVAPRFLKEVDLRSPALKDSRRLLVEAFDTSR